MVINAIKILLLKTIKNSHAIVEGYSKKTNNINKNDRSFFMFEHQNRFTAFEFPAIKN